MITLSITEAVVAGAGGAFNGWRLGALQVGANLIGSDAYAAQINLEVAENARDIESLRIGNPYAVWWDFAAKASAAPLALIGGPAGLSRTIGGRLATSAAMGGISQLTTTVENTQNGYWGEKAAQVATGAAFGFAGGALGEAGIQAFGAASRYASRFVVPSTATGAGNRAARVTFTTDGFDANGLDSITLRNFGNYVGGNSVSHPALRQVQRVQERIGGNVNLQFGEGPSGLAGEVGRALDGTMQMDLYMLNRANMSAKGAASTFVHESSHYVRGARGFEIGTQVDEYMAFRREKLFELGRRPSFDQRREVWNNLRNDPYYSTRPVGGDVPRLLQGLGG